MIPQKIPTSSEIHGNLPGGVPAQSFVLLAILMAAIGVGKLTGSLIHRQKVQNGNGGGPVCWADVPIIGVEFPCALDQKILSVKVLMVLVMTGLLVTMM